MIAGVLNAQSVRFASLLAGLSFALLAASPIAEAGYPLLAATISLPAVLLGAVIAVGASGWVGRTAVALWFVSAALELVIHFAGWSSLPMLTRAIEAIFLCVVLAAVLRRVALAASVTPDVILGGICGYLLLGFVFVLFYSLLELARPGSFLDGGQPLVDAGRDGFRLGHFPGLTYYSFVTMTTLGYGDVAPVGAWARSLATLEAVAGQLYLAILIAALVGLRMAERASSR